MTLYHEQIQLCILIMGKFQEFVFFILTLQMNLSWNNCIKHAQIFTFLGGNVHKIPKYRGYFVWKNCF